MQYAYVQHSLFLIDQILSKDEIKNLKNWKWSDFGG
jgi:hypothetical protein